MISRRLLFLVSNIPTRLFSKSRVIFTKESSLFKRSPALLATQHLLQRYKLSSTMSGGIVTFEDVNTLKDDANVYLIDVREPSELKETGEIPNSINIPLGDVENVLKNISDGDFEAKYKRPKPEVGTPIIFSCKSGKRAGMATDIANKLGFNDVKTYVGSWMDWEKHIK